VAVFVCSQEFAFSEIESGEMKRAAAAGGGGAAKFGGELQGEDATGAGDEREREAEIVGGGVQVVHELFLFAGGEAGDREFDLRDGLGGADGEDYCILSIQHRIYEPPDTARVGEAAVGFGDDPRSAIMSSYKKALQRIRENPRSRPNLRRSTVPSDIKEIMPMPRSDERDFIVRNIRLWGRDSNWRCYLNYEYLEMK